MYQDKIANEIRTARLYFDDAANPLVKMQYVDVSKDPSDPKPFCRLTVDHNSSSASKLIVLLDIGASATDYVQYQFSASGVAIADPNSVATGTAITATATTDLGALIDALNAIDGVKAYRLNAPADYSLDTDDFGTAASVRVGALFVDFLYKDVSEVLTAAVRIGVPEMFDHGRIALVGVDGYADSNSATDCVLKISRDPVDGAGGETSEEELFIRYVPDAAITALYDWHNNPPVVQGPIMFEITATTSLAAGAYLDIRYCNAEL